MRRGVRVDTNYQVKQHTEGSNVQVVVRRGKVMVDTLPGETAHRRQQCTSEVRQGLSDW